MHELKATTGLTKAESYREVNSQLSGVFSGERNGLANAANMAALLFHLLPNLNWAGFYFMQKGELVLGPFQGKVACVRIAVGKGVCGTAAARRETIVVPDVHAFPGHIACDSASRSEIVVPLISGGKVIGVLDLDSPVSARFDGEDRSGLERAVRLFLEGSDPLAFVD
ncbi:MAG TPA: GAF domain-containing protein [Opitutaceae bacterium]|jgi:GAF domain-containing protein|nr:GAF domain-containing protein [Opitutaceae bacterium]